MKKNICEKCFYFDGENYCDLFDIVIEHEIVTECKEFTKDEDIILND